MSDDRDDTPTTKVVRCPPPFAPLFAQAESIVAGFFGDIQREPEKGQIHVQGVRYMLMRTDSLGIELQEELRKTFGETGARQIRYKLGKACGMRDARLFAERLGVEDPNMRMAMGPVHFAHVGWANVDIFEESAPQPNEDFFMAYAHPYSFEAEAYLDNERSSAHPVCHMSSGYSAGWCEVSYGFDLKAEELSCRARGDAECIFAMAQPHSFTRLRDEFKAKRGLS